MIRLPAARAGTGWFVSSPAPFAGTTHGEGILLAGQQYHNTINDILTIGFSSAVMERIRPIDAWIQTIELDDNQILRIRFAGARLARFGFANE